MKLKKIWQKIKDYRSNAKNEIDAYVDPILFSVLSNGAILWGGDQGLEYISNNINTGEQFAMMGAYTALGATLYFGNKHFIIPVSKKIHQIKMDRFNEPKLVGAESWVRTSTQIGALATLYCLSSFNNAINNYSYDFERVTDSFARPKIEMVEKHEKITDKVMDFFPLRKNGGPFDAGALEGYNLSNFLYTTLTGLSGEVPKKVTVDFDAQLLKMYKEKSKKSKNPVVDGAYKERIQEYINGVPTYMTLDDYVLEAEKSTDFINQNIDWNKIKKLKKLTDYETKLLKSISLSLDGKDLISYGLTELMPSQTDGKKNMAVADFILRNAGREYLELIPAMADKLTSFGFFQFTQYALYNHLGEIRGASIINKALPKDKRIADSVVELRKNDHFKAAYMLGINNVADLIKSLSRSQLGTLASSGINKKSEIVKYIATAHNKPKYAIISAKSWLDNKGEYNFFDTVHSQVESYARKTHVNWYSLHGKQPPKLRDKEVKKSVIKQKTDNSNLYIDTQQINSQGKKVFRYTIRHQDNPTKIAREFNNWDYVKGDKYEDIIYNSVVYKNGNIAKSLFPGQEVYILARKKK